MICLACDGEIDGPDLVVLNIGPFHRVCYEELMDTRAVVGWGEDGD